MIIWQIILFIFVLSFLVIIHELGHYLVAKWQKVRVEEFGVGYPPRAVMLFKRGETIFSLNWIPFGGFVKLEGEEGPESDEAESKPGKAAKHANFSPFYAKGKLSRLMIILAGASVNFIFGILAFSIYFSVKGIPDLLPRIGEVSPNSPVAMAQVPTNVNITGFELRNTFYKMATVDDVTSFVSSHLGDPVTLFTTGLCSSDTKCDTTTHQYEVTIRTKAATPPDQGSLGIAFAPVIMSQFYPWYQMPFRGAQLGFEQALDLSKLILVSLAGIVTGLFKGHVPTDVSGPVGIFTQARQAGFFSGDVFDLLNLAGLLSVNLAIMNVLPIPALDGGRAFFILIESVVSKKRLGKIEGYVNYVAFGLLVALTVLITVKDVATLFIKK